jgi:hypothetical protein
MIALVVLGGCVVEVDVTPPSMPRGIATATGDNFIEITWLENPEPDVAGYDVYVSDRYDGQYVLIGTTSSTAFLDRGARNGITYYYAVAAFDRDGNTSTLSRDVAYDTPRPEGYSVRLRDFRTQPDIAGYDFSTYSTGPYDDPYTDVFFEYDSGAVYLDVWDDTEIQDMGYTASLYEIGEAPLRGWSPTHDESVIPGHTYVVRTWDNHYAKLRVVSVSATAVVFDWAYQLQSGNTRLKASAVTERPAHALGSGAAGRN